MSKLPGALCNQCPLNGSSRAVPGYGPKDAEVIFVGEAPGVHEEEQGIPFVGQSGQLLDAALSEVGVANPDVFMYKTNVVACRPPNNRTPTQAEMSCCLPRLKRELSRLESTKIIAMGRTAQQTFGAPNQIGAVVQFQEYDVMTAWHPAYILRSPSEGDVFMRTMDRAVNGPFDFEIIPKPKLIWPKNPEELAQALSKCPDGWDVSFDIETDQVQWYDTANAIRDMILMIQIAWTEEEAIIIDHYLIHDMTEGTMKVLKEFFNRVKTIAHNGKFDTVFLMSHFGVDIQLDFDTLLAHYILNENIPHGLKPLASLELGMVDYEEETIAPYLNNRNDHYSKIPAPVLGEYGAWDVVVTLRLKKMFEKRLKENGQYDSPFMNVIMPACRKFRDVELRGFPVDFKQLEWLDGSLQEQLDRLELEIQTLTAHPNLNPRSPQQLAEMIYDEWHWPLIKARKVKPRTTGKAMRAKYWDKHPFVPVLDEYKRVQKMHSSYVKNIGKFVALDGRVHADFRIPGTEVGRISVADPPLQTIPRAEQKPPYYGRMIKSLFYGGDEFVVIVCDYSQAELRVYACETGDPFLLDVYKNNRDLHTEVSIGMYGEGFSKEQRVQCKMFNFSYIYGGNEYSFAQDSGLNISVAKRFVQDYNNLMPVALEWKREQFRKLLAQGYVETIFHRRRHFPVITASNREEARKACVHMPIASTANDLTLLSGIEIENRCRNVVLLVHDSVITLARPDEAQDIADMMIDVMQTTASTYYPQIPWKCDADIGVRWAEPVPIQ